MAGFDSKEKNSMPIYGFKCEVCNYEREDIYKNFAESEEHPPECPNCKVAMKRDLPINTSAVFVGSGFHVNDYKRRR